MCQHGYHLTISKVQRNHGRLSCACMWFLVTAVHNIEPNCTSHTTSSSDLSGAHTHMQRMHWRTVLNTMRDPVLLIKQMYTVHVHVQSCMHFWILSICFVTTCIHNHPFWFVSLIELHCVLSSATYLSTPFQVSRQLWPKTTEPWPWTKGRRSITRWDKTNSWRTTGLDFGLTPIHSLGRSLWVG